MTIRINVDHHQSGATTISLHGWIESEEEAVELLSVARESSAPLVLDLQELNNVDANGLAALTALSAEGARLVRTSDFIKLLLKTHMDPRPSSKPGSKGGIT
jgi:anti-anti-sigma regulatory factor